MPWAFWGSRDRSDAQPRRERRTKSRRKTAQRRLFVESLETREVFAGVVDVQIAPLVGAGTLNLVGDGSNNDVEIRQTTTPGEYTITGKNGTLLQLNTAGVTMPSVTINGIIGNMTVGLGTGNDTFTFAGITAGGVSNIPGNLTITNDDGSNVNILDHVMVNGDFTVNKLAASSGYSELQILSSTVIGDTIANNVGVGSGDTKTTIDSSSLQAGGAGNWALLLINGTGQDILDVRGSSQFGTGSFIGAQPIFAVVNGAGGSRTTFTGASQVAGPGTTTVYGNIAINNGGSLAGQVDIVTFNGANVLGGVTINNANGTTQTMVLNSTLGSHLSAGLGGPLLVNNNAGFDELVMTGSSIPYGAAINNDVGAVGASLWGSSTQITNTSIGTRPLGPALPTPGDALQIIGDNGADIVNLSGATLGGTLNVSALGNGNNSVSLINQTAMAVLNLVTGSGNDTLLINDSRVSTAVNILLGAGSDTFSAINVDPATEWPSALLGAIVINGGAGVDFTDVGGLALGAIGFELPL